MSNKRSSNVSLTIPEEQDADAAQTEEVSAPEPFAYFEDIEQGQEVRVGASINHEVSELLDEIMAEAENMNQPSKMFPTHSVINVTRSQGNLARPTSVEASQSRSGTQIDSVTVANTDLNTGAGTSQNNNNCMALLPYSSKAQMIPIALLRKTSTGSVEGNFATGGLMQIIAGTNKVAPAVSNPESATTVGAAVLMLVPKKSDAVCIDMNCENDQENNCTETLQQCANISNSDHGVVKPTQSYDSYEEVCRICHDNPSKLELISPCLCKGSMSKVHRTCLERWLGESAKNSCEICGYEYNTVRKPKYTGCNSIYQWIRHPLSPSDTRNLFFDIACFFILTPLAAISSWLCVVGAQHYTFGEERRKKSKFHDSWGRSDRADASNATWTSVGLLSLTGTLLVAYTVWLFVAIKFHIQAWSDWQQRNFTVTIVPFEDGCMSRPPASREGPHPSPNNSNGSPIQGGSSGVNDGHSNNNNVYNFEPNPNFSHHTHFHTHSTTRGRGRGRNFLRHGHHRHAYNLPSVFNRSHFLRNPPPGYTISETTMLYEALYGSDSESFFNENILQFLAESSDVTEDPSTAGVANAEEQVGSASSSCVYEHNQPEQEDRPNNNEALSVQFKFPY